MTYLALLGSPRKKGNTAALLASFLDGAASKGHSGRTLFLQEKKNPALHILQQLQKRRQGDGQMRPPR